jgi:hypothetical protein
MALQLWTEFDATIKEVIDRVLAKDEDEDTPLPEWNPLETIATDLPTTASLLNLLQMINRDVTSTPFYARLHLLADTIHLVNQIQQVPDAILWDPVSKHVTAVMYVHPGRPVSEDEYEVSTLLDEHEEMVDVAGKGNRADIDEAIAQLNACMTITGATYGILTTFFQYWFVMRNAEGQLLVSHTVWESDEEPSVMQCLYAFIEKSKHV